MSAVAISINKVNQVYSRFWKSPTGANSVRYLISVDWNLSPLCARAIMTSTRLVLIMCLMLGHTSGQQETCAASVQGVSGIAGVCPSTWIQWGGHCYKATGQTLKWQQARQECVQMGGRMVVPQPENETQFLLQLLQGYGKWILINCNDLQVEG